MSVAVVFILVILILSIGMYILGLPWYFIDVLMGDSVGDDLTSFVAIWARGIATAAVLCFIFIVSILVYAAINGYEL
ncbi:MAG: hypothetical protein PHX80_03845 [Candidatus Nanoarchaeia archaeon]|nr:hypothetical protein [Candidatus Nanoarchaeia archaeon]